MTTSALCPLLVKTTSIHIALVLLYILVRAGSWGSQYLDEENLFVSSPSPPSLEEMGGMRDSWNHLDLVLGLGSLILAYI
jgi:hypothetical protein